jgi:hypothetical protein
MKYASIAVVWVAGPLAVAALAGELGSLHAKRERGELFAGTSSLSEPERKRLEAVPARVMDNVAWTLAGGEVARQLVKFELDALDDSEGARRARVFIRFGLVDSNFDGQAAVFASACTADPNVCDSTRLKEAAAEEASVRYVPPGNHLPLSLIGGHPPIGPRTP